MTSGKRPQDMPAKKSNHGGHIDSKRAFTKPAGWRRKANPLKARYQ